MAHEEDCTLWPVFEPATGYLYLTDGTLRQIVCRVKEGMFYVFWRRKGGTEHPLTLDQLLEVYLESKRTESP